jgi:hypothetical protein
MFWVVTHWKETVMLFRRLFAFPRHRLVPHLFVSRLILPVAALLIGGFWGVQPVCQATEPLESKLPANTIFSVSGDNLKEAWAELNRTQLGKTWFGPQFDPLRKALFDAEKPSMLHLRPWWGFDWDELKEVDSEAAFVLIPNGDELGAVWWFGRDPAAKHVEKLRTSMVDYFEKKKKLVAATGKFGDATWLTYVAKKGDDPKTKAIGAVWVVGKTGIYSAGNFSTAESLSKSLVDAKVAIGTAPGMATALEAMYADAGAASKSRVRILARPLEIAAVLQKTLNKKEDEARAEANAKLKAEGKAPKKAPKKKMDFFTALKTNGGDSIQAIGLRFDLTPDDGEEVHASGIVVLKRPLKGAATILDLKPTSHPEIPEFIPDDVGSAMKIGFNFKTLIEAFRHVLDAATEEDSLLDQVLDGLRDDPNGPKLDIRKDVFPEVGDSLLNFTDGKNEPDRRASAIRRASLIQIKNADPVVKAADRLWGNDPNVTKATFNGNKTYTCPVQFSMFNKTDMRAASVWKAEKLFALGNNSKFYSHAFGPVGPNSLTKDPDFQRIDAWWTKVETKETCVFTYLDPEHILGNAYQAVLDAKELKDDKGRPLPEHPGTPLIRFLLLGGFEVKEALAPKSLPTVDKFMAPWKVAGFTLANTEQGLQLDMVWLGNKKK